MTPSKANPTEKPGKKPLPSDVLHPEPGMVLDVNRPDLIEACQRGEDDAFRALFESHGDRVYSIAFRYSGDSAAAMDIAQETFLKLLSNIRQFRGEASFESWLYRLVVNNCLDYYRRQRRFLPVADDVLDTFRAPREGALGELLREERQERVQQAVAHLPEDQRIVVVLRYTEGLSYDEIADLLGCRKGTVASRLNRAHKSLERRLSHLRSVGQESVKHGKVLQH